jgi:hypothetical protein
MGNLVGPLVACEQLITAPGDLFAWSWDGCQPRAGPRSPAPDRSVKPSLPSSRSIRLTRLLAVTFANPHAPIRWRESTGRWRSVRPLPRWRGTERAERKRWNVGITHQYASMPGIQDVSPVLSLKLRRSEQRAAAPPMTTRAEVVSCGVFIFMAAATATLACGHRPPSCLVARKKQTRRFVCQGRAGRMGASSRQTSSAEDPETSTEPVRLAVWSEACTRS